MLSTFWISGTGLLFALVTCLGNGATPYTSPLGPSELAPIGLGSRLITILIKRTGFVDYAPWLGLRQRPASSFVALPTTRLEGDSIAYSESANP